jgi:hypothetical protein
LTTFWALLFGANEIKDLTNVKASNVVFFAKNVVFFGVFLTTAVVKTAAAPSRNPGPPPLS